MTKKAEITAKYIPFIKWVGGKRAIADQILGLAGINTKEPVTPLKVYIEPFLGGGAMFFHLKNVGLIGPNTEVFLSDMNKSLINTYKVIQEDYEKLIMELKEHQQNHGPDSSWPRTEKEKKRRDKIVKNKRKPKVPDDAYYYYVRDYIYNDFHKKSELSDKQKIELAAAFIYLNRTGFNGMYRENADGEMNIPRGRYINPAIVNEGVLRSASEALKAVESEHCPYQDSLKLAGTGSLVYFDPPYYETFTDYNGGGFGEEEQIELAQRAMRAAKSGVKVIISNSSNPFTRELYKNQGFEFDFISAARNINSDGQGRSKVVEIVAFKTK
jgi:DNA adenine methylase